MVDFKRLRKMHCGMTQQELADAVGVTVVHITNIENGKNRPSVKLAKKLGEVLDFDWKQLFDE